MLDFSWNPLVGIWFACECPGEDGKLFIINTNDPIQVAVISSDESEQRVTTLFQPNGAFQKMAYWEPTANGEAMARILRQRSVFVIGRPKVPEDSNIIGEITINKEDKEELIKELALLDVNYRSLFLDSHGFAETNRVADPISLSQDDYLIAGNRYFQQREFKFAIEAYGKFVNLNPDSHRIYFLRANAHAELRNHLEAIEDYDRALSTMIKFPQSIVLDHMIYFNRANSQVELKHYKEALQDYLKAIELAPDPMQYNFNLANTYAEMLCFQEAISTHEKVSPANWHTMFNKGNALICLGKFVEARECYVQAAVQAPENQTINQNLLTSSSLLNLLAGIDFTHSLDASRMHLQVFVSEKDSIPELHQHTYIIAGRVGNIGNSGYMHTGGKGFAGKGPITISISSCADQT